MKTNRILTMLISFTCVFMLFGIQAFAIEINEKMPADMDQKEVRKEIVDDINTLYEKDLSRKVTLEDVDLSKSYKFYIVNSIRDLGSINFKKVRENLEKGVYIYEVPVLSGDSTYIANIQITSPVQKESEKLMTPEMVEHYKKRKAIG